ncbi:MAG: Dockerin protein, partial [Candidatus Hydrogenedentes bacterium]|nr:Dockerin protein [Candidatus Hydrogenedentota bacterium]
MRTILFDAVLLLAGGAFGAVILVPADQPTIAAAIAVSTAIDQIEIAPGTYTESNLVISHDLTIRSPYGTDPSLCVVQAAPTPGTATNRVFAVIAGRVTIDGLTIRNGGGTVHGAGVGAGGGTILSLSNCRIVDNRTTSGNGGGVYSTNGYLSLWQCTVSGNTSTGNGGGVSV